MPNQHIFLSPPVLVCINVINVIVNNEVADVKHCFGIQSKDNLFNKAYFVHSFVFIGGNLTMSGMIVHDNICLAD